MRYVMGTICAAALLMAGCGGGGGYGGGTSGAGGNGGPYAGGATYAVSVTVSGLNAPGLVLQNNAGDNLAVSANGVSTFATAVAAGASYAVTVLAQPDAPAQVCSVSNGTGVMGSANVTNVAVSCRDAARFAYVANGDQTLSVYSLDTGTGAMTSVGPTAALGSSTSSQLTNVIADPKGHFVIALDKALARVQSGVIDRSTGKISATGPGLTTPGSPSAMAMAPYGKFLFIAGTAAASPPVLVTYAVSADGVITATGLQSTLSVGARPLAIKVDAQGQLLYVSDNASSKVDVFSIDANTGDLTALGHLTVPAGATNPSAPTALALDPLSKSLFVADSLNGTVFGFDLTSAFPGRTFTSATTDVGISENGLAMDPKGRFVYVASYNPGKIFAFKLDPTTRALSAGPITAATGVSAIAIDPSGQFVYATDPVDQTAAAYSVNGTTGALTKIGGDVPTGSSPAGPAPIVLSR